jgi:hypothetical protein
MSLFRFIGILIVYGAVGYVYKRKIKTAQGREAIPNVEVWRELPWLVNVLFF